MPNIAHFSIGAPSPLSTQPSASSSALASPAPVSTEFEPADLLVIDLTARIGLYALQQLHAPQAEREQRVWRRVALGEASRPCLDWFRPGSLGDLGMIEPHEREPVLLVGPGSLSLLRGLLRSVNTQGLVIHAYALPNALLEVADLRAATSDAQSRIRVHQLPSSQEQVLWLCLMEQFQSLLAQRPPANPTFSTTEDPMSNLNEAMAAAMKIEGATAVALVDHRSGMLLAQGGGGINLELAAAGNTEVIRAKLKTAASLGLRDSIEDILITLSTQYHLIRPVPQNPGLFLYLVLDKQRGNLALARYRLAEIERTLKV